MLDWTLKKEDFGDNHYILPNARGFFCRYADSGFRTKWCGMWSPPIKHVEYYAYKIRSEADKWLSWEDCTGLSINPWGVVHTFKPNGFDASETIFLPESKNVLISILKIKNNGTKRKVSILLEAAVNMRRKSEDWHTRTYDTEFNEVRNWVMVRTQGRPWFTGFGVGRMDRMISVAFTEKNEYKEHNPGSPQRCYLPGDYEVSFDMDAGEETEIPFIFACSSKSLEDASEGFDKCLTEWKALLEKKKEESGPGKQLIRTPDSGINKAFLWNAMALRSLIYKTKHGTGMLAGLPWFLEFWARDSFICIPALNHIGEFSASREILEMFLSRDIPSKIDTEGNTEQGFADTYPLFALAMDHYADSTGNAELFKVKKNIMADIAERLELDNGFVIHDPEKTWMDSYKRGKSAIEVQSLWPAALRSHNLQVAQIMESKIGEYWDKDMGYFHDSKNPQTEDITINALAPLMLDQLDGQKVSHVLDRVHSEFATKWGVRTRSANDREYRPDAYHKGAVWGLTTGAAACACFKFNRTHQGLDYLRSMAAEVGTNAIGASAEVLDADTGKLLGCGMQAWSSAMFITAVDEFLFGIKPRLEQNLIVAHPRLPDEWEYMERFGKKIRNRTMDFMIRRDHSRLTIDVNFDSAPTMAMRLVLPAIIKKCVANGKVIPGNVIEFELKKHNNIVALS